jgi:phage terminase small subunit
VAQPTQGKHTIIIVNPWVTVRDQAAKRMQDLSRQLGISPDSRIHTGMTFAEYLPDNEGDDDEDELPPPMLDA